MTQIVDTLKKLGNIVAYYPSMARALGSINNAVLISQFIFITRNDPQEWFSISWVKIEEQTGINRRQLDRCKKELTEMEVLTTERIGMPAKTAYKVNWDRVEELLITVQHDAPNGATSRTKTVQHDAPNGATVVDTDSVVGSDDNIVKKEKENNKQIFLQKNYAPCMDLFFEFYKTTLEIPPPKIDGSEGKALKSIIKYLADLPDDQGEDRVLNALKFIFDKKNWLRLPKFYQEQITLKRLNSNLTSIINEYKKLATGQTKVNGLDVLKNYMNSDAGE